MLELVADGVVCKDCLHAPKVPCFLHEQPKNAILISETRYREEEVREAVRAVIQACPHKAVELRTLVEDV